ncbi:unnamed protein product [Moneuplotes crassus]|uniref:Uncharacterized protein n=1 Tax=Euplotes crassus TaxID=5936 RepID=A0AAD1Y195_EUPCR|nr:unnamed protein product [Moneuplotes crassus]
MKFLLEKCSSKKVKTSLYKVKDINEIDKRSYKTHLEMLRNKSRIKRNRKEKKLNSENVLRAKRIERKKNNMFKDKLLLDKEYFSQKAIEATKGRARLSNKLVEKANDSLEEEKGEFDHIFVPFPEQNGKITHARGRLSTNEISIPPQRNDPGDVTPNSHSQEVRPSPEEPNSIRPSVRLNNDRHVNDSSSRLFEDFSDLNFAQITNHFDSFTHNHSF